MDDPKLAQLGEFTPEGILTSGYGQHYLFFVGRDDVHGILLHLLKNEKLGFDFNQFGFDDSEINDAIMTMLKDPSITVQATLDKSQAAGAHEKEILASDEAQNPTAFGNSFAIGESATHQISHTKGGIFVGQGIAYEGSTNWSGSGEGIGVSLKSNVANPQGFKAQNNTVLVSTNPVLITRFQRQLLTEHRIAQSQMAAV